MKTTRAVLAALLVFGTASKVTAQSVNRYGEQGRTVLQSGLAAYVHGSGYTQSREGWGGNAKLTLVHFVKNNFAVGGTVLGGVSRLRDSWLVNEPINARVGADLDLIGHVALSRHVSLRFWGWAGLRLTRSPKQRYLRYASWNLDSESKFEAENQLHAAVGFSPQLLLHVSSSVALGLGPSADLSIPLLRSEFDWSLNFGPSVSYSFGSPPASLRGADEKPVLPRFAGRGRRVLRGGFSIGTSLEGSVGYARFVSDHFALGPLLFGGARSDDHTTPYWLGGGLQMIAECPLGGRWSLLFMPEVTYRFDRMAVTHPMFYGRAVSADMRFPSARTHQIQLSGAVVPVFHLFEALVFGVGPSVTEHIRFASDLDLLDRAYLTLGVTSFLAGSF